MLPSEIPSFLTPVEGRAGQIDAEEVRRALALLIAPGTWHELRGIDPDQKRPARSRIISGDNIDQAVEVAKELSDTHVYWSLNPVKQGAKTANKKTVTQRRWLLIDIDTVRIKEVSATDAEKANSCDTANAIAEFLMALDWPIPVMVDSGNGWHLLYRIDLPADTLTHQVIRQFLEALGSKFDNEHAIVDKAVHDAPRISKLPGTMARKGVETEERPHRISRLIHVPENIGVVTFDQLKAIGEVLGPTAKPKEKTQSADGTTLGSSVPDFTMYVFKYGRKTNYVQSAIEGECLRIQTTPLGNRNNVLNTAAFRLATLATWPETPPPDEVRERLRRAAISAGLSEIESNATITSGWSAGLEKPRVRPENPQSPPQEDIPAELTVGLDTVQSLKVDWLWQDRVARGFITVFVGRTGVGKSFIACDFVARLSRGDVLPLTNSKLEGGRTLIISEDPLEYMLAPRLAELKADRSKIRAMTYKAMSLFQLDRIDMLEKAYLECGKPTVVVIDPPSNFCGKIDSHKDAEVRMVLMGIVEWVNRHHIAMIFIMHFNKAVGKGVEAVDRLMGSVGWASVSRTIMVLAPDPDDPTRCLFASGKNNIGERAPTMAYRIAKTETMATVEWIEEVDTTADDAVNKVKRTSRAEKATTWLIARFRERPSWPANDLYDHGRADGISRSAIWEAVETLDIRKTKITPPDGSKTYWQWSATENFPPPEILETIETNGPSVELKSRCGNGIPSVSIPFKSNDENRNSCQTETLDEPRVSSVPSVSSISRRDENRETIVSSGPLIDKPDGYPDAWIQFNGEGKNVGEVRTRPETPASRWLFGFLMQGPCPKGAIIDAANTALLDPPAIEHAAKILGVIKTTETGDETWRLP